MSIEQLKKLPVKDAVYAAMKEHGKPVGANELVMKTLRDQIEAVRPIQFVGFWGIGGKDELDANDYRFIGELEQMQNQIGQLYTQGAHIKIILADMHGVFNGEVLSRDGKDPKAAAVSRYRRLFNNAHAPYLQNVALALQQRGIDILWLSDLYAHQGLEIPNIHEGIDASSQAYEILMEQEQGRHDSYLRSARHNNRGVPVEQAAYHYLRERLQEQPMLVDAFPNHIFFVNGGRNLALRIVPENQLPILYLREGPVWFQHEGGKGGE